MSEKRSDNKVQVLKTKETYTNTYNLFIFKKRIKIKVKCCIIIQNRGEYMNQLDKARQSINEIDKQMAELFEKRMETVEDVVAYKIENNMQVLDRSREKDLLIKNLGYLAQEKYKESYIEYFNKMMEISRNYQKRIINKDRIGYGGTLGAFSHIASMHLFPHHNLSSYTTFEEIVKAVENGDLEYGVIPFENSFTGEVVETSDLLRDHNVYIQDMYDLKITQNLLGVHGATLNDIEEIYSHPQGLSQCSLFLKGRDWKNVAYPNTALAAQFVSEENDKSKAAIASLETAEIFNLEVLEENINTSQENTTRFIVISKKIKEEGNMFQMLFTVKNETGSLANAMNCIAEHDFNMKSIKSRAIPNEPWRYYFHVEIEGNLASSEAKEMIEALKAECSEVKILGGYTKKEG